MQVLMNRRTKELLRCRFEYVTPERRDLLEGLVTCLRDGYGDSYPRPEMYELDCLAEELRSGRLLAMLAVTEDGIPISSLGLAPCAELVGVAELIMHVVRRAFREYGIGTLLTRALLDLPEAEQFGTVTAHAVTVYPMAQHQTLASGMTASGFLFSVYGSVKIQREFVQRNERKQSLTIAVYPEQKRDAGILFCPPVHREVLRRIYGALGVRYVFGTGSACVGTSELLWRQDERHHTLTLKILHSGVDLGERLDEYLRSPHHPEQTINIQLDLNEPAASAGYEVLKRRGFFFTGLQPLCGDGELFLLHHPLQVQPDYEALSIDAGYQDLFEYVKRCAEEAKQHENDPQ